MPKRRSNISRFPSPLAHPIKRKGRHAHPLRPFLQIEGPNAIRSMREIMGFSRKDIAHLYGIRAATLASMETGNAGVTARFYLWLEHLYLLHRQGKF